MFNRSWRIAFYQLDFSIYRLFLDNKSRRNEKWIKEELKKGNNISDLEKYSKNTENKSDGFAIVLAIVEIFFREALHTLA